MVKRIGLLTGGGDVPGLNPCIKNVVTRAEEEGLQVVGIRRGWRGLVAVDPAIRDTWSEHTVELDRRAVRTIDRTGGTMLHTSRTNPSNMKQDEILEFMRAGSVPGGKAGRIDITPHVMRVLDALRIDLVISIGGDDTQSYAVHLSNHGIPVLAIPKTMDNDVHGTDYCIGFSTAITRSVEYIHRLRTSTGSHERIAIVELFGRNCGETSLVAAYLSGADRALISEVPVDPERLSRLLVGDKKSNPSNYAMMTVSEGATFVEGTIVEAGEEDAYGHRKLGGIGLQVGDVLKKLTGEGIIYQQLAYLMRSGEPDSLDLMVALNYANMAIDLVRQGLHNRMVVLRNGVYTNVPVSVVKEGVKRVDVDALYDSEQYRPKVRHMDGKPMFLY